MNEEKDRSSKLSTDGLEPSLTAWEILIGLLLAFVTLIFPLLVLIVLAPVRYVAQYFEKMLPWRSWVSEWIRAHR